MIAFAYTGRSAQGNVSGTLEAATAGAAADVLLARGVTPLKIVQTTAAANTAANNTTGTKPRFDLQAWMQPQVQPVDKLLFSRVVAIDT